MPLLCLKKCFVLFFEKKKKRDGERRSSRLVPVSEKALHFVLRAKLRLRNVTGTSGTAILRLGHEILSKILIRCVTWHWACDCSFRCFRHFPCKMRTEQDRARRQRNEEAHALKTHKKTFFRC